MNKKSFIPFLAGSLSFGALVGCSRDDPRINSNPHPQGALEKKEQPAPVSPPAPRPTEAKTGTDSTGRPADASGGTTGPQGPGKAR